MEIISEMNNEIIHMNYLEYEKAQLIANLSTGETVSLQIKNDKGLVIKKLIFSPKFINSHFCFTWQDKGEKSLEPLYERKFVLKE